MSIVPEQLCVAPNATDQAQIYNNQIYTQVTNYADGGSVVSTTGATVNVVPNTYLTSSITTAMVSGSAVTGMSFGTIQPGTYTVSCRYVAIETAGVAGDYLNFRVFASTSPGITAYGTTQRTYFLTNATNSSIDSTFTVTFVLPIASPLLLQGNYSGSTACSLTIYPGVTLQKIA